MYKSAILTRKRKLPNDDINDAKKISREILQKDPLQVSSVNELILQHISGRELIDLTKVAPSWNATIGNSEAFAKKVKFCIREFATPIKTRFQIETVTTTSVRRYNNYQIIAESVENAPESLFLKRNDWKCAEIFVKHFVNTIKYEDYLSPFTPSIVELELRSIYPFSRICQSSQNLIFKKLRSLTILNCCSEVVVPFLKLEQLTTLRLINLKQSSLPGSSQLDVMIPKLVHRQKNVTYLELNDQLVDFAFKKKSIFRNTSKSFFMKQLKKLVVSEPTLRLARHNLFKFIAKNGSTIENIQLNGWLSTSTIYHIWDDLPNLKQFHQNYHRGSFVVFDEIHRDLRKLERKSTLEKLALTFTYSEEELEVPLKWLRPIMDASPNLIELIIQPASDIVVEYIDEKLDYSYPYYCKRNGKEEIKLESWTRDDVESDLLNDFFSDDSSDEEEEDCVALSRQDANSFESISDSENDDIEFSFNTAIGDFSSEDEDLYESDDVSSIEETDEELEQTA